MPSSFHHVVFFQGAVSGVLLVTPNNIMFDPHRMDPMVQAHGCEEYGIMCPLEEVQSAAIYKEITDPKIRETVPEYGKTKLIVTFAMYLKLHRTTADQNIM